ncbi:MAG: hypothetical protein KDK39_16230, partial [Leptospiraceae bacterium]|nr:hypothetical protein [Leptospiraceae bacterium]
VKYPKYRKIPAGKELIFRFNSSCAEKARLIHNGQTVNFPGEGSMFDMQHFVHKGSVKIEILFNCGDPEWKTLLEYEAE